MSLFEKLKLVKSEEDVKDIYIKALGLKGYSKNLIDIQTKEIWFEAKDNSKLSSYAMFTQLLHYVQQALNKGEYVPPFLAVVIRKNVAQYIENQEEHHRHKTFQEEFEDMLKAAGIEFDPKYFLKDDD